MQPQMRRLQIRGGSEIEARGGHPTRMGGGGKDRRCAW
jgi:hypothetical protein